MTPNTILAGLKKCCRIKLVTANFDRYKQSKNPERYLRDYISEITLFQKAANILKRYNIDPEKLNLEAFLAEYFRVKKRERSSHKQRKNLPQ